MAPIPADRKSARASDRTDGRGDGPLEERVGIDWEVGVTTHDLAEELEELDRPSTGSRASDAVNSTFEPMRFRLIREDVESTHEQGGITDVGS